MKEIKIIKENKQKEKKVKVNELYYQKVNVDNCSINKEEHVHLVAKGKKELHPSKFKRFLGISLMILLIIISLVLFGFILFKGVNL